MFNLTERQAAGVGPAPEPYSVPCGIGLGLDNGTAARPVRGVANEPMAEQCRRHHLRRRLVKTPGKRPEASHLAPALYCQPPFPATCLSSPAPGPDHEWRPKLTEGLPIPNLETGCENKCASPYIGERFGENSVGGKWLIGAGLRIPLTLLGPK